MRSTRIGSVLLGLALLVGCGTAGSGDGTSSDPTSPALTGTVRVFAAASLRPAFEPLRAQFRDRHPGVDFPEITYDGSSVLLTQLTEGAEADVFAAADTATMDRAVAAGITTDAPVVLATNQVQLAVAPGNPRGLHTLQDLTAPDVRTVLCQPVVPCGAAARAVLEAAGVTLTPVSEEQSVSAVRTKVELGEADAGIVYRTDVLAAGGAVEGVDLPGAAAAATHYPIATLTDENPAARAFVAWVTGPDGRAALDAAGFGAP